MTQYRQGDVLLVRVREIPAAATLVTGADARIVERGELTGHAHRLEGLAEIRTRYGVMYVEAGQGASLVHEEHASIALDPGAGDYSLD